MRIKLPESAQNSWDMHQCELQGECVTPTATEIVMLPPGGKWIQYDDKQLVGYRLSVVITALLKTK